MEQKKQINEDKKIAFFYKWGIGSDREYFLENLGLLLGSGVDILTALKVLRLELRSAGMKRACSMMEEWVDSGFLLSEALQRTGFFQNYVISLVKIGEVSGKLESSLNTIALQEQKNRLFRSKLNSAALYPVIVFVVMIVVGAGVVWYVLPKLAQVFSQLNIELPLITRMLLGVGTFLSLSHPYFLPLVVIILLLITHMIFVFEKTKFIGQFLIFRLPGLRRLIMEIEIARFGSTSSSLLEAGLPIEQVFDSLVDNAEFYQYKKFYFYLKDKVLEGNSLRKGFGSYRWVDKLIPPAVQQIVFAGEASAGLTHALKQVGERYEEKTNITAKNIGTIFEPLLLVIVWLGVLFLAMAVVLPIYSLIGDFGTNTSSADVRVVEVKDDKQTTPSVVNLPELQVLNTDIGFLNVRLEPRINSTVIKRALPGETYTYVSERSGWYEVLLSDDQLATNSGWVSSLYVETLP